MALFIISAGMGLMAQEPVAWMEEYTGEKVIGKETFRYEFSVVEGNECKVEVKEIVTGRKGEAEERSWVFYLSDLDPGALRLNTRGKAVQVTLETENSQEFISSFEEGSFEEYTSELVVTLDEVDLARRMIEDLREHIGSCQEAEITWKDNAEALDWIAGHIGDVSYDDMKWEQQFSSGDRPYLATLSSMEVSGKGGEEKAAYVFDLSDIDPLEVSLEVSGQSLAVELPVRDRKRYIRRTASGETEFLQEVSVYADDIEEARQMVRAFRYLASNTVAERQEWDDYNAALDFLTEHPGEVTVGDERYEHNLEYDLFASDILNLSIRTTDSDGETDETVYSFYPADMTGTPVLQVDRDGITVLLETLEDHDYIRKSTGGVVSGYVNDLELHAAGIDDARDLIGAWEYIIKNSEEELETFESTEEVNTWMADNFPVLYRDGDTFEQSLSVDGEADNRILFEKTVTEEDGESTAHSYVVYAEDILQDELDIVVRFGKLTVTLETGRTDYIRHVENDAVQDFTNKAEVYFFDPLVAKNFIGAIRFLIGDASGRARSEMTREDAFSFLSEQTPSIELPEESHEQTMEVLEPENCKLKFTRLETGKGGEKEEYVFEFIASDLSEGDSDLSVRGSLIEIKVETAGNRDLVKPYENGEVQDFTDEFVIYADDVRHAKKILQALGALSRQCE